MSKKNENAFSPMKTTFSGIITFVKFIHLSNADASIEVILLGIVILSNS